MRRRELIMLIGGAVAWPFALLSQSSAQGRRIGVLMAGVAGDPELQARLAAFAQGLQQFRLDGRSKPACRLPLVQRRC